MPPSAAFCTIGVAKPLDLLFVTQSNPLPSTITFPV